MKSYFCLRSSKRIYGVKLSKTKKRNLNVNVPVIIDGKGKVFLGNNISFGYHLAPKIGDGAITIQARYETSKITIGDNVEFSNNISIISVKEIRIGDNCLIADFVTIFDADFHDISPGLRKDADYREKSDGKYAATIIENNVWIGSRSIILKGVTIGEGSVIGAGSIVTQNIPANVLACGNPAKVIKSILD